MEENKQLVGNICASIEELGNVIVDNVAASHKDYESFSYSSFSRRIKIAHRSLIEISENLK